MKTISNFKFQISNLKSQACLLLTAYCLLLTPAVHAEIIDRIVAVVNDSAITMSELNAATAGLGDIKGADKDKRKKIMETKSKVLDQLIEKKLVEQAANKAGITVSEKEIDNSIDDVKRQNNIGQEELLSALAKNGLTFKEYREQLKDQIRQVKFINKEFRSNIKMSDEDVEAYYMQNKERFSGPLTHKLRIISFYLTEQDKKKEIEKKAKDVLAMAQKGEGFAKLAKEYSQGPNAQDGGDLGYVKAGEMDKAIEKAAAALNIGETSDIIKTSTGFHIIRLEDKRKAEPKSFSAVEDDIKNIIFQKIIDERYRLWLDGMMKKAYIEVRL
ncbi:MAG: peptidylprolyl isomerase [Deltaproteobacteria bacterium]|nr:peptidylprolyl isomerase [Deltaproteobacteria bacterium]